MEVEWHIYASVNQASISSEILLLPFRLQAIFWTGDQLLLIGTSRTNFNLNQHEIIFIQPNTFEYVVYKMAVILC